jgi:predicted DNA-binding transcriptional regulator YafY
MAKNEPLKRYFYEIELMRKNTNPNLKDIKFYLENRGVNVSTRTIERDIEQIRQNFGVVVMYDTQERSYYIDEDTSPNLQSFIRFLELANTAELFLTGIKKTKDFIKDIEFDSLSGLMGTEHLGFLLNAIQSKLKINFTHISYWSDKISDVTLAPYFLKEYQGRWYVVGLRDDDEIRTYGIDRISNLEITKESFKKTKDAKARANFDSIIGLIYSSGKQEKVVLSFKPQQGRYVKSLPWHHSQKILIDNEEELRISLFVVPNFELFQKVLMNGADVVVMEPEWLKDEIKKKIAATLKRYS